MSFTPVNNLTGFYFRVWELSLCYVSSMLCLVQVIFRNKQSHLPTTTIHPTTALHSVIHITMSVMIFADTVRISRPSSICFSLKTSQSLTTDCTELHLCCRRYNNLSILGCFLLCFSGFETSAQTGNLRNPQNELRCSCHLMVPTELRE